jgi:hypothetical protein
VLAEIEARMGLIGAALERLDRFNLGGAARGVLASALITRLQIDGVDHEGAERLLTIVGRGETARHRLVMLRDLSRVGTPEPPIAPAIGDKLEQLTRADECTTATGLLLVRAELFAYRRPRPGCARAPGTSRGAVRDGPAASHTRR